MENHKVMFQTTNQLWTPAFYPSFSASCLVRAEAHFDDLPPAASGIVLSLENTHFTTMMEEKYTSSIAVNND
jgi:hypothetical protein